MVQNVEPQEAFFVPVQGGVNTLPWRYLATSEHNADLLDEFGQVSRQLVFGVDFTISPEGDTAAGNGEITLLATPTATETQLRVRGDAAAFQPVPPEPGTAAIVGSLDRMAIVVQQVKEGIARVDVPAEIEASQAAAAQAALSALAAAQSALDAATFNPANFQPIDATLDQLSGATVTAAGLALLDDPDVAAQRDTLGVNSAGLAELTDNDDLALSPGNVGTRGNAKAYTDANAPLVGQTLGSVTKALATNYLNDDGKWRFVMISLRQTGATSTVVVRIDQNVTPVTDAAEAVGTSGSIVLLSFWVPPGWSYRLVDDAGGVGAWAVRHWRESQ